jgi:hypothetical protein
VQLEALLDGPEESVKLGFPMGQDLVALWNRQVGEPGQQIQRIYWNISKVPIHAILDRIRTALAELVAEMRAGMSGNEQVPSPELANQAVQIAVHGRGSRITFNNAQSASGTITQTTAPEEDSPAWKRWLVIGGFIVGVVTVIGVAVQIFGG